ncbi:phosphoribosyl-ATP diphosphatase [Candidatus Methylopumilus universalis]|jgi:phosphoribosyl-ATP pyrophosphohydrolase|uniref:Phosphoribosyl-ATP pyrophosphatase n=2 Tax=Candidatus Methylopumilus TaxID=1679002 RepID=A0AAX1EY65_9PROT|nr:phosphoribosyl-ATP diphosphatase [Candidatus Methylopumilus universalis]MBP6152466.1 phosphoribosyl-ATP diphosphatase [Candidatus Methylopumilus sp.]MCF8183145.1 phosphoribosyl-ATP diphosphatase [Limnohabitans sp.]GDX53955.1 phosphoribosyl-ATP pyrophosphatase [Methylophilaceae bacterium]MBW0156124.1 phosphoribosyl-ATP diphosphatase [Candidatus Methylopumilus sp.]MCF8161665.1 phosphoribosyl-ATP diphosphatase [Candidatus Methylopumilus sp.]
MNTILKKLTETLEARKKDDPTKSYTASLYRDGLEAILKKVNEEAFETIIAARQGDNKELIHEVADLWFHTLVLMAHKNLSAEDILNELAKREGTSGIEEKENRSKSKII